MTAFDNVLDDLRKIVKKSARPLSTREVMDQLGLSRSQRRPFRDRLKELARQGEIVRIGTKWALPVEDVFVEGVVECHPDGYAFLRPDDKNRQDVFIPPGDLSGGMHGDRVRIRVTRSSRDGRESGRVLEVIERGRVYVVGKYRAGYLYPTNDRILERIFIAPNLRRGVTDGELAEARITEYPAAGREPEGEIICRLGSLDSPGVDLAMIVSDHNLPREFPQKVVKELETLADRVLPEDFKYRKNMTGLPFVTIDPESARDFDDAVYAKRERSGWRLWVAIADVGNYVESGTRLDKEALARSTSVYFPEGVIPMLPEKISAGLSSLKPGEERLAIVVEMSVKHDASIADTDFYPAVIRSAARLSYDQVRRAMIENDKAERKRIAARLPDLEVMMELSREMRAVRQRRGSLDFDLPEAMVILGAEGAVEEITKSQNDPTHQMIEEFMLAANEAVAYYMQENELPCLYRVHEPPSMEKLESLSAVMGAFGLAFDYRDKDQRSLSKKLQRILDQARGKTYETVLHTMVLRSMQRARYDPKNLGHFGLAADSYLHFTSPIRRYPDLFVHRMLKQHLAGKPLRLSVDVSALAEECSRLERRAEEAERDMDKLKAARFMKERIGREYEGYVVGVTQFGIFVEIIEHFVEGLVHESRLPPDIYKLDQNSMALTGKRTRRTWRVGDKVKVIVAGTSIEKRQVDFELIL